MTPAIAYLAAALMVALVVVAAAADQAARVRPPARRAHRRRGIRRLLTNPPAGEGPAGPPGSWVAPATAPLVLYPDGCQRPSVTAQLWGER